MAKAPKAKQDDFKQPATEYTEELADRLCAEIAAGRSVKEICETEDWAPAERSVYRWLAMYADTFGQKYTRAKASQQDAELETIIAIADAATVETVHVDRLRIETRKWSMARLAPKKYGDKLTTEVGGIGGGPVSLESVVRLEFVNPDPAKNGGGVRPAVDDEGQV